MVAPPAVTVPVCLECLIPLSRVPHVSPCPRCHAPLCDNCVSHPSYHLAECEMFQAAGVKIDDVVNYKQNHIFYACILHLRMWKEKLSESTNNRWKKINFLQEESNKQYLEQEIWNEVADYIHKKLKMTDIPTSEVSRLSGLKVIKCLLSLKAIVTF